MASGARRALRLNPPRSHERGYTRVTVARSLNFLGELQLGIQFAQLKVASNMPRVRFVLLHVSAFLARVVHGVLLEVSLINIVRAHPERLRE